MFRKIALTLGSLLSVFHLAGLFLLYNLYDSNNQDWSVGWVCPTSDWASVVTFVVASLILGIGGLIAWWRTALGFYMLGAGYFLVFCAVVRAVLSTHNPVNLRDIFTISIFLAPCVFFVLAGIREKERLLRQTKVVSPFKR